MHRRLIKFLSLSILLITLSSVESGINLPIHNTFMWWTIYASILYSFIKASKIDYQAEDYGPVKWYLAWNIICILRGLGVAETYWEWKNLVGTGMVLLLPLSIHISTKPFFVQRLISTWLKFALPAFLLLFPFMFGDATGRYLVPISFLLLFLPSLKPKWRWIILGFGLFVFFGDLDARSNVIKFGVPIILSSIYLFKRTIGRRTLEFARLSFMVLPFILFFLGLSGVFNIFKMSDYIEGDFTTTTVSNGTLQEQSLTADTRTFLYVEVLTSAVKHDHIWLGRTPARGNDSPWYFEFSGWKLGKAQMERFGNEVSILNVFTWTGIIGVFLYFLVFFRASYLAINRSNNTFMQIVGLNVAFRWSYAWVEDFSNFDLSYLFLWLMLGMCFSKRFRFMNNREMLYWIRGIFERKYLMLPFQKQIAKEPGDFAGTKSYNI